VDLKGSPDALLDDYDAAIVGGSIHTGAYVENFEQETGWQPTQVGSSAPPSSTGSTDSSNAS
jgi:hypothetical protein